MLSAVTIFKERKVCKLISLALILRQVFCGCSKFIRSFTACPHQSSKLGSGCMGQRQPWWWWRYNLTSTTSFYRVTSPYATGLLYSWAIGNSPAGFLESADIVVSQQLWTQVSWSLSAFQCGAVPSNDLFFLMKVQNDKIAFIPCCYINHPTHSHAIIFKASVAFRQARQMRNENLSSGQTQW